MHRSKGIILRALDLGDLDNASNDIRRLLPSKVLQKCQRHIPTLEESKALLKFCHTRVINFPISPAETPELVHVFPSTTHRACGIQVMFCSWVKDYATYYYPKI